MAVVSNSSPLIVFSKAGRLDILRQLFDEVLIPEAVFEEVVTEGVGRPGSADIANLSWIKLRPVADARVIQEWARKPGHGEGEAIALAVELGGGVPVLIDDRLGRKIAQDFGLHVVGSAGVLVRAKDRGLIPLVRPILEEMRALGLYLNGEAEREILASIGELSDTEIKAE